MNEELWITKLANENSYCETLEEKTQYKSALAAALNWSRKINKENAEIMIKERQKRVDYRYF